MAAAPDRHAIRRAPPVGPPHAAAAGDRPALTEMLARCSDQTRALRFHKYVRSFPEPYLTQAFAGSATHFALLAHAGQAVVALASCVAADGGTELAVLVEDSWQRLGVGARLLSLLVAHADQHGLARLKASVLASHAWVLPVLGGYGTCEAWLRHGVFEANSAPDRAVTAGAALPVPSPLFWAAWWAAQALALRRSAVVLAIGSVVAPTRRRIDANQTSTVPAERALARAELKGQDRD